MNEVELKLAVGMNVGDVLARSDALGEPTKNEQLVATYFDTDDGGLAQNGVSLRIRREGDELVQTTKSNGSSASAFFNRTEQNRNTDSTVPLVDADSPVAALLDGNSSSLRPTFTIEVERTTWIIEAGECNMELVLDLGRAIADERQGPISELEIELRSGTTQCLFKLARRLGRFVPVRLGIRTKADRGWALLAPEKRSIKAEKLRLDPQISAVDALREICMSCIRQFRLNEDILLAKGNREALHQARVAIRRLRSALTAFRSLLSGDDRVAELKDELRWLASELGRVRDIDVLLEKAKSAELKARLRELRKRAYADLLQVLDSTRSRLLFVDLAEWLSDGDWLRLPKLEKQRHRSAQDHAIRSLARLFGKVERGGECLSDPAKERQHHELRKASKKLRYASEFFESQFAAPELERARKKFATGLKRLQNILGRLNDVVSGADLVHSLGLEDVPEARELANASGKVELLASAQKAHMSFLKSKRYWQQTPA